MSHKIQRSIAGYRPFTLWLKQRDPISAGISEKLHMRVKQFHSVYTLLQKKCTLISSSSPSDPGSLTPTSGHVEFVKWSWEQYPKVTLKTIWQN